MQTTSHLSQKWNKCNAYNRKPVYPWDAKPLLQCTTKCHKDIPCMCHRWLQTTYQWTLHSQSDAITYISVAISGWTWVSWFRSVASNGDSGTQPSGTSGTVQIILLSPTQKSQALKHTQITDPEQENRSLTLSFLDPLPDSLGRVLFPLCQLPDASTTAYPLTL